jgi:hypothetical protein
MPTLPDITRTRAPSEHDAETRRIEAEGAWQRAALLEGWRRDRDARARLAAEEAFQSSAPEPDGGPREPEPWPHHDAQRQHVDFAPFFGSGPDQGG